jgi:outer membrane usher protein
MVRELFRISFFFILISPQILTAADQRALLELKVNEVGSGEVGVLLRDADVLVRLKDLQAAGLKTIEGSRETIRGETYILLSSLAPQVLFKVDDRNLSLNLTVRPAILGLHRFDNQTNRPPGLLYSENPSSFINYSVSLRDFKYTSAFSELGISVGNNLFYNAISKNEDGAFVRGLSQFTISNRENLNRTVLGDRLVSTDILGGSVVMSGVSFFREFNLDPYYVRSPGLNYSGAVATPSTLEVYVNNQLLRRVALPPGEFELKDLPVPVGAANTRMILRDAFGREQEIGSQYYFTGGLLRAGLHEFSYNLGVQRNNLATRSWDYGPAVILARHRVGITDGITAGGRLEASPHVVSGGPSLSVKLPIGEMELGAAASGGEGAPGGAAFLGFSYVGYDLNVGASARVLSPHYANTSLSPSDNRSWLQLNALLGFPISSRVGLTLRYTHENSQVDHQQHQFSVAATTRLTSNLSLFVTGGLAKQASTLTRDIFTGLTFFFGQTTGSVSYQNSQGAGGGTVALQKSMPLGSGFGYRFQAGAATGIKNPLLDSLVQYQGPYGRYEANYSRIDGHNETLLNTAGGLAFIGGDFFVTRPVQDSFAVIQVPGIAGVRGYSSNQDVGHTNFQGNLFVPNLLPYYGNRLGISDKDVPLNYTIAATEKLVAPPFRGGAVVSFPIDRVQRITGKVVLEDHGAAVTPAYGQLSVRGKGGQSESPIGKLGEFYLENLGAGRFSATVDYRDKVCAFNVDIPNSDESEIDLGTVICRVQ